MHNALLRQITEVDDCRELVWFVYMCAYVAMLHPDFP